MTETAARKSALVVIDVQNGVVANAYDRDGVVDRIGGLIDKAKAEDVPVIWIQHEDDELVKDSEAWQIVEAIRPADDDIVVPKRYEDAFAETTLRETLDRLGVGHVVVTGASTDWCVRATTTRAMIEGFDMTLVEDAHTTGDSEFDLTDGEKVSISGKQVVAHHNMCLHWVRYPGVTNGITPAAKIEFTA